MKKEEPRYTPPFTITDEITTLVIEIGEVLGRLSAENENIPTPKLRKENRIKTIQSSLAIENNSLSIEQVTDIIDGKRVLGAPNEIKEVKNAIDVYNLLFELNPYKEADLLKAHSMMTSELVEESGKYRHGGVGVFNGDRCVHMAPPAVQVPILIRNLLSWTKTTKTHPLIHSCVFHYELEFIHPFADGNGRMARLVMNMLQFEFGLIPTKILKEDKEEYIKALVSTREDDNLDIFRGFMTSMMEQNLQNEIVTYLDSIGIEESREKPTKSRDKVIALLSEDGKLSAVALAEKIGISAKAIEKHLANLKAEGIIERIGPAKGGYWKIR